MDTPNTVGYEVIWEDDIVDIITGETYPDALVELQEFLQGSREKRRTVEIYTINKLKEKE